MFGPIPAYGFFIRHVKGIEFDNVEVGWLKEDLRPAFVLHDVQGAEFRRVKAQHAPAVPTFILNNVEDFSTHDCPSAPDMRLERVEHRTINPAKSP